MCICVYICVCIYIYIHIHTASLSALETLESPRTDQADIYNIILYIHI